jgi:hypothetical protein
MAATKASSVMHNNVTLTAGAGDTTATVEDVTAAYQTAVRVRLTNGATGPTIAANCKVQVSEDATAGNFMTIATVAGNTTNNGIVEALVQLPDTAMQVRTVSGSNTAQNVTLRVVLEKITAL